MSERLYALRQGQGYFETGLADGKQIILANTVHEIVAHWFDMDGVFLGLTNTLPRRIRQKQSQRRTMRKVTFGGANSLDNYLARADDALDWLLWGEEAAAYMADYWKTIDTVLMGRKTYEVALRMGQGGGAYPGVKTYVFSRTLPEGSGKGVTIIRGDVAEFVRGLKGQDGKDICLMGGGELARSLFEAGLIDEIGFNIHPVLLGSGVPLFHPMSRQIDLELRECKAFQNGCVLVTYRVKH